MCATDGLEGLAASPRPELEARGQAGAAHTPAGRGLERKPPVGAQVEALARCDGSRTGLRRPRTRGIEPPAVAIDARIEPARTGDAIVGGLPEIPPQRSEGPRRRQRQTA